MQIIFCFNSKKTVKVKVQMQWPGFKSDLWPFVVCLSLLSVCLHYSIKAKMANNLKVQILVFLIN